jgi:hypothetical protein
MEKINIYCHKINTSNKINKYVNKLGNQIYEMTGGANFTKHADLEAKKDENMKEIVKYISTMVSAIKGKTKDKYLVILMGAPGSGKTLARKVAAKYIHNIESTESITESTGGIVYNSFIDISIDNFVYDGVLVNSYNTQENHSKSGKKLFDELKGTHENIEKSSDLYFKLRVNYNSICEIILNLAAYLGLNVFFEILGNETYITHLIQSFCIYYGYKLIIIYPYIINEDTHISRADTRAKEDGRYISSDYIKESRTATRNLFEKLKTIIPRFLTESFQLATLIEFDNTADYRQYNYTTSMIPVDIYSFKYNKETKKL